MKIEDLENVRHAMNRLRAKASYGPAIDTHTVFNETAIVMDAVNRATPRTIHPDDVAVDRFAEAMKAKLAQKRAEGRGGWEDKDQCSREFLSTLLREHVEKGDPLDIMNFAMMLHQRGETVAPASGYIPLPRTKEEAEMMHLLADSWLKNNITLESKGENDEPKL